ncbi:MAG: hypothetical protein H6502_01125 [Candidatus Woesearchaeota archaeon]|nr:MAG: hypothetical protein H6502_01125 [Candidatus Woesearchaeota archaeon]
MKFTPAFILLFLLLGSFFLSGCFLDSRVIPVDVMLDVRVLYNAEPVVGQKVWYHVAKSSSNGNGEDNSFVIDHEVSNFEYTDQDGIILKRLGGYNLGSGDSISLDVQLSGVDDPKPLEYTYHKIIFYADAQKLSEQSESRVHIWRPSFYIEVGE